MYTGRHASRVVVAPRGAYRQAVRMLLVVHANINTSARPDADEVGVCRWWVRRVGIAAHKHMLPTCASNLVYTRNSTRHVIYLYAAKVMSAVHRLENT